MDINDLDLALHEISLITRVAINSTDELIGSKVEPGFFHMPADDAQMLDFALLDLRRRIDALMEGLEGSRVVPFKCA
jgi:hypothetical protein